MNEQGVPPHIPPPLPDVARSGNALTIRYTIEPRDVRGFQLYGLTHGNAGKIRRFFLLVLVGFSIWMTMGVKDSDFPARVTNHAAMRIILFCIYFLILFVIWRILEFLTIRIVLWRALTSEKNKSIICEHTMSLTDDALIETTAFNEGRNLWKGVHRVVDTADYIYIYLSVHSAHIIPKRAFPDADSARYFYERARKLHSEPQQPVLSA
jgi:hypothetical protein